MKLLRPSQVKHRQPYQIPAHSVRRSYRKRGGCLKDMLATPRACLPSTRLAVTDSTYSLARFPVRFNNRHRLIQIVPQPSRHSDRYYDTCDRSDFLGNVFIAEWGQRMPRTI